MSTSSGPAPIPGGPGGCCAQGGAGGGCGWEGSPPGKPGKLQDKNNLNITIFLLVCVYENLIFLSAYPGLHLYRKSLKSQKTTRKWNTHIL